MQQTLKKDLFSSRFKLYLSEFGRNSLIDKGNDYDVISDVIIDMPLFGAIYEQSKVISISIRMLINLVMSIHHSLHISRIPNSLSTPLFVHQQKEKQPHKMSKTPDLPNFSGEVPTLKGKAEFDNWIFQLKLLQKTYTDDAIRNTVVSHMRGVANMVVCAVGYNVMTTCY